MFCQLFLVKMAIVWLVPQTLSNGVWCIGGLLFLVCVFSSTRLDAYIPYPYLFRTYVWRYFNFSCFSITLWYGNTTPPYRFNCNPDYPVSLTCQDKSSSCNNVLITLVFVLLPRLWLLPSYALGFDPQFVGQSRQYKFLVRCDYRKHLSGTSKAPRSPGAMNVSVCVRRQVKMNHMGDVFNVQPAGSLSPRKKAENIL